MPFSLLGTIALVSLGGIALAIWLLRAAPLRFTMADLGGFTWGGLAVSSVFGLYLELLLIRWISSEIRIFAYFKNFVLIACFLGFGLGCYLCRRAVSLAMLVAPLVFLSALIALPWAPLRQLVKLLPVLLGATSEVQIWGVGTSALTPAAFTGLLLAAIVTMPLFALIALTFVPIGQLVGYYLESARSGIAAYTVNVVASMAGIGLYTALCFADQPPWVWFGVAAVIALLLFAPLRASRYAAGLALLACAGLVAWGARTEPGTTYWSPYQKLNLRPLQANGETVGWELLTNSSWFQKIIDLSPEFVRAHPALFQRIPLDLNAFNIPYRFAPHPRNVLVLGSGMGNDVAAALRNGAEHVTAVDIDPLIIRLGRELHPEHPYASPRVTVVNDDARAFIRNTSEHFDVIVFSALDSHTTSSHFSNIRIDNYVYTVEALQAAKQLLTIDGICVLRFQVQRAWIAGRLHDIMATVFGQEPLHMQAETDVYATGGNFFIAGSVPKIRAAMNDPQLAAYVNRHAALRIEHVTMATDDWPYLYQREPGLPTSVVTISALLLVVCVFAARSLGLRVRDMRAEFFFLGAAFMLLEAQIISRMALLFGTTWIVNSIVIAVLLLLIVAANGVAAAWPKVPLGAAYAGILITIAICWAMPLDAIFFRSFALRATVGTLLLCSPVFFAGIVFIKRFAASGFAAEAIGSNLLGALAGGILESASLWLGLRALLVIAFALYAAAWLASRRTVTRQSSAADVASGASAPSSPAPAPQ
jgi:spermidine synthase